MNLKRNEFLLRNKYKQIVTLRTHWTFNSKPNYLGGMLFCWLFCSFMWRTESEKKNVFQVFIITCNSFNVRLIDSEAISLDESLGAWFLVWCGGNGNTTATSNYRRRHHDHQRCNLTTSKKSKHSHNANGNQCKETKTKLYRHWPKPNCKQN